MRHIEYGHDSKEKGGKPLGDENICPAAVRKPGPLTCSHQRERRLRPFPFHTHSGMHNCNPIFLIENETLQSQDREGKRKHFKEVYTIIKRLD